MNEYHLKSICKIGQGKECCRYILIGKDGFECAKNTSLQKNLDDRVEQMNAQGDNCKEVDNES